MNCPYCKIPSMGGVASGEVEVDRCRTCGAAWFDPGEIRELTQGRLPAEEDAGPVADPSPPAKEEKGAALRLAWGEARGLPCPRCGEPLRPVDFQLTGVPVFRCGGCGGMLVSRRSAKALSARFKFQRDHAQLYESLGASMAEEVRGRMNRRLGPDVGEVRVGRDPAAGPRSPRGRGVSRVASPAGGVRDPLPDGGAVSPFPDRRGRRGRSAGAPGPPFRDGIFRGAEIRAAVDPLPSRRDRPAGRRMPLPLRPGGQRGRSAGAGSVPSLLSFLRRGRGCGACLVGNGGDARRARFRRRRGGGAGRLPRLLSGRADRDVRDGPGRHRPRLPLRVRLGGRRLPVGVGPGAPVEPAQPRAVLPRGAPRGICRGRAGAVLCRSVE